jgi:DNA-directed RNA polymerase specialized sigma24 family protein
MTLISDPTVIKELQPIVEHFVQKSAGYSVDTQAFEDAYAQGFTGMILNPENFEDKKAILTALIAKTKYELQTSRNVRRSEDRFRAAMPTQTQEDGSWEFPEAPETNRRSISQYRHLPTEFLWCLPTRTRQAVSMLRDGLSYSQVAEIMQISAIEGLVNGVQARFAAWSKRQPVRLSAEDEAVLSHGKWRVPALEIARMRLLGFQNDIIAWRLGIDSTAVSKAIYVILRSLPHLRPAFQR